MAPILYQMSLSPPCRAVSMVAKMIGVELQLEDVNLMTGDHLKPEFLKINPRHTIPVLKDGHLVIPESRAICTYLISKYAPDNDKMYPKCPAQRALVDSYLQFDLGTFYKSIAAYYYPVYFKGAKDFDETAMDGIKDSLAVLETYLGESKWFTGDHPSVADVCLGTSLTSFEIFGFDMSAYPKLQAYYQRFTALPEYVETQKKGVETFRGFILDKEAKRKE